jgi:hypothetical protein
MPTTKEPNFFVVEGNWHLGVRWYEHLFEGGRDALARGEASVSYSAYPSRAGVPLRVANLLPDVRLIYLVRHPVERMLSALRMDIRLGNPIQGSFEQQLLTRRYYVDISRYSMQIEQYLECFPRDRLLVIKSETLRSQPVASLDRIYEFIGVDPSAVSGDGGREWHRGDDREKRRIEATIRHLPGYGLLAKMAPGPVRRLKSQLMTRRPPQPPTVSEETKHELEDRVREDVRRLYAYMGPDFDGWGIA